MTEGNAYRVCPGKYGMISLVTLVVQGCLHSLVLRFSRTIQGPRYLASVAVIFTELLKILVCLSVLLVGCWRNGKTREEFSRTVSSKAQDLLCNSLPMAVPATMYVMQQMLVIVAATHLDVVTFQICSQMKVFPTAIFASALLGQHLSVTQWLSLPVLAGGVSLVTATGNSTSNSAAQTDWTLGVAACLVSGISSAFAGVYFEKYVKGMETSSLWIRNCQLSMYGLPLGFVSLLVTDRATVMEHGVLQGFSVWTWGSIVLQAFGGIVVGMVVKYADNILKNFANALSVICTVICAIPIFNQYPSPWSLLGLVFTFTSIFMYSNSLGPILPIECCTGSRHGENGRTPLLISDCLPSAGGKEETSHVFSLGRYLGAGSLFLAKDVHSKNRSGHGEHSVLRNIRYMALITLIVVGIALLITGARLSMHHSFQSRYVLWGQTSVDPYKEVSQHWGLDGPHPWRARIRMRARGMP
mmetsp:Transcript_40393/g.114360  ORF Transcript_40393/g.114360 Transcript_40393/m.114360 type:complete len:470 (+) Transcript_40393:497-1906(+)